MFVLTNNGREGVDLDHFYASSQSIDFFSKNGYKMEVKFTCREAVEECLTSIEHALRYGNNLYIIGED